MNAKGLAQKVLQARFQKIYDKARAEHLAKCATMEAKGVKLMPTVLFTSASRAELGGNMKCVHDRMVARGMDEQFNLVVDTTAGMMSLKDTAAHKAFYRKLAQADVIFCDDYHRFLYFIDYPSDVKIVQLWHAVGAFKTVGFARKRENAEAFKANSLAHRCYTHVIVSAECDRPHYAEAFNLPVERIFATGIPRIDDFLNEEHLAACKQSFFEKYPQAQGKRVILFAPTFRGEDVRTGYYDFDRLDLERIAESCRKANSVFVLKFHPFVNNVPQIPAACADVLLQASEIREINDILPAASLVITDYSSVIYESSLLGIPMVFYAYDLEEYESTRGFFEPYESFVPGPIAKDFDSLLQQIETPGDTEASLAFRAEHFAHLDANSTDRVIDLAF